MRLRQKKTHSLSEDAFYQDFQNSNFQTLNRKSDLSKKGIKDNQKASYSNDINKVNHAQILMKFIRSVNLAKHQGSIKSKIRPISTNISHEPAHKLKRLRKTSENTSFDQEKKVEYPKSMLSDMDNIGHSIRSQSKRQKSSNTFSIERMTVPQTDYSIKQKELSEQNIINNCFTGNSFNMTDYAKFIQSGYFSFNAQLMNGWFHPFIKPNWQSFAYFSEDMKNGLYRQLSIYEQFKPQSSSEQIQKKSFMFPAIIEPQAKKTQNFSQQPLIQSKISPDKIFKRASYHVGIAYSIYMDNVQKEGKNIKKFSDIDPTRFAKKYKQSIKK